MSVVIIEGRDIFWNTGGLSTLLAPYNIPFIVDISLNDPIKVKYFKRLFQVLCMLHWEMRLLPHDITYVNRAIKYSINTFVIVCFLVASTFIGLILSWQKQCHILHQFDLSNVTFGWCVAPLWRHYAIFILCYVNICLFAPLYETNWSRLDRSKFVNKKKMYKNC